VSITMRPPVFEIRPLRCWVDPDGGRYVGMVGGPSTIQFISDQHPSGGALYHHHGSTFRGKTFQCAREDLPLDIWYHCKRIPEALTLSPCRTAPSTTALAHRSAHWAEIGIPPLLPKRQQRELGWPRSLPFRLNAPNCRPSAAKIMHQPVYPAPQAYDPPVYHRRQRPGLGHYG